MVNLTTYQGNDKNWKVTVTDENGAVVNISTAALTFSVKADEGDVSCLFQRKNIAAGGDDTQIAFVTDGADGIALIKLVPTNTSTLNGNYVYDLQMVLSSRTLTVAKGILTVIEKVT